MHDYRILLYWKNIALTISIFLAPLFAFNQIDGPKNVIEASFIKKSIYQKSGELSFNVIRLYNTSNEAVRIHPILRLPNGWSAFSNSIQDTIIPAGDSLFIPLRLRIQSQLYSQDEYTVELDIYSNSNQLLTSCSFLVQLEIFHSWDVIGPDKRILLFPNQGSASFVIKLLNRGNTTEIIDVELQTDNKLTLLSVSDMDLRPKITLKPNQDTLLEFKVTYDYNEDRIFDIGKIQIFATNGITKIYRSVFIEKYSDKYDPFSIDQGLLHSTEIGFRSFSKNNEILPYIKTRGKSTFKNDGTFKYNFTYYNLRDREDFIGNSYYNFLYTQKNLNVGLGAFSSMLGRNLYSRNSLMISDKIQLNPENKIEGFLSYGLIDKKTSVAFGYDYDYNKIALKSSASYDIDDARKTNTSSFILHTNKISLAKNHDISAIIYAYHEKHYLNEIYNLGGIAYDMNYFARLTRKIEMQIYNSYGSPNIPGAQMGLFSLTFKSKFLLGKSKNSISTILFNTERKYHHYNRDGQQLPYVYIRDQYGGVFFQYAASKLFRFYVGPSIEFYYSSDPSKESNQREIFKIEKYRIEFKGFYKQFLMFNIKYGLGNLYYFNSNKQDRSDYDFHFLTDLSKKGYGLQMTYDFGPMSSTGLYQYAIDNKTNGLSFSPYIMKNIWNERLRFTLFSNLVYRFDLKYGTININPRIEAYLYKNWYIIASGSYNYTRQSYLKSVFGSSFYYMEFAVRKNWGKNYNDKWQNDLRRLDIQMFKDDNGNGFKDNFEKGIPNVKVRIKLTNSAKQYEKGSLPIDITLVTNEKGFVSFNSIPQGFYDLIINPLSDLMEYFYIGQHINKIELLKNDIKQIPFQKAHKLEGNIDMKRQKFVKESEINIDLTNIKVTAYNNQGNSYSAFTDANGKFIIFVPGNQMYYVRITNVFGENYIITNNDINAPVPESVGHPIVFQVVEKNRQINFKKISQPKPDSIDYKLQKIKVLAGTISQKDEKRTLESGIETPFKPKTDKKMLQAGKYYLVLAEAKSIAEAVKYRKIFTEQGLIISFGYDDNKQLTYIYTNYYLLRDDAQKELKIIEKMGIKSAFILKYKPE